MFLGVSLMFLVPFMLRAVDNMFFCIAFGDNLL